LPLLELSLEKKEKDKDEVELIDICRGVTISS